MPGSESTQSPLVAIRDKERAMALQISAAQERADAKVAEARARAESVKQQAEREGMQEAEALYQQGLSRAREQAQVVVQGGQTQAAKLHDAGLERIGKAVDYILRFVLPHNQ